MSTEYWTMKNGTKISVDDMTVDHLRNTLKMIIRSRREAKEIRQTTKDQAFTLRGDMAQQFNDSFDHGPDIGDDPWWDIMMGYD